MSKNKSNRRVRRINFSDEDEKQIELNIDSELFSPKNIKIKPIKFKSDKQKAFYNLIMNTKTKLLFCDGLAGSAKSFLSLYAALKLLKQGKYDKILYVRSATDSSKSPIGFLKGDLYDKSKVYMVPLEEKLEQFLEYDDIFNLKKHLHIEATINNFMRGRSIDDTIVIIDEIQNLHFEDAKTLLTRFEENTKIICIGDHSQSDIGCKSCFVKLLNMFDNDKEQDCNENGVFTFKFDIDDVVRSGLTKFILEKYEKYEKISR